MKRIIQEFRLLLLGCGRDYDLAISKLGRAETYLWNEFTSTASWKERGQLMPWQRQALDILSTAYKQANQHDLIRREA